MKKESEQLELFQKEYDAGNGSVKQDVEWDSGTNQKVVRVLMGIPNEGHTECESYDNRLEMAFHLGSLQVLSRHNFSNYGGEVYSYPPNTVYEFSLSTVGKIFPALARERIAEIAVGEGFDYLFMIDDDMLAPKDLFERLVKHDKDIVAALAFTRQYPHYPVIYNLRKGYDEVAGDSYYINTHVKTYPKDKLVKCDAVGFGAVLIKVDVLMKMKKPLFMSTSGAGEDIHFCHKAGEQGFSVYMDTTTKLTHLGYPKQVTEETYEKENQVGEWREQGEENKYDS